jgi:3'-phosphoadenosine 5'-phosphosulfate sulfotransferase (PAPS reductase)/FAD synthetase
LAGILQAEIWPTQRPDPRKIIDDAIEAHKPAAVYALFSGGDGSLHATHWAMANVPGCKVAHINTGVGLNATRQFVHETCKKYGWDLTEIRAKEDCGQDYDEIVRRYGFPGPASHRFMYIQLKERAVNELVRRSKRKAKDRVMLLTGVKHDDSARRSGYGGGEITRKGGQVWVNHMYWVTKSEAYNYLSKNQIARNPVSLELGMSGECGCGAFASRGELAMWRRVDPTFADRIDRLQDECMALGVHCNWETAPNTQRDTETPDMFAPMCVGCLKETSR